MENLKLITWKKVFSILLTLLEVKKLAIIPIIQILQNNQADIQQIFRFLTQFKKE